MTRLLRHASEPRGVALLRVLLVPVALITVAGNDTARTTDGYPRAMVALAVYALVTLVVAFRAPPTRRLTVGQAAFDLAFAALLVHSTGGPDSPLTFVFYVLPIGAALRLSPALTAAWSLAAMGAYLAVAVPDPATNLPNDWDLLLGDSLSLLWVGAAAVMLAALVGLRQTALAELAATRRALVQQALDVEAAERRRLAEELHDHAIQNVLVARQEIADIVHGIPGADQRARAALDATDEQLRREVFQLHPLGVERAGLSAVLRDLAETAAGRGGFTATVDVDPAAERGGPQELLVSSARELLANVAKHARAAHVDVTVRTSPATVELTVADDGRGIPAPRLEQAVAEHHIGLASVIERVRGFDGDVRITTVPGEGTSIWIVLPRSASPTPDAQSPSSATAASP